MTAMPEPDGGYDRVLSAFGAMFAPDPYAMAAELVRVCAPGGVIAVLAWIPDSPFGQQADIIFGHLPPQAVTGRPPIEAWGNPSTAGPQAATASIPATAAPSTSPPGPAALEPRAPRPARAPLRPGR
jgi:hypothetical protein